MSHILYRTNATPEYEKMRDQLKAFCKEFAETQFNGRPVSILVLKNTLALGGGFAVSVIELPALASLFKKSWNCRDGDLSNFRT